MVKIWFIWFMVLSNFVVMGTLFQFSFLLSRFKSDQSYLISQLLAVDEDLSGINYFDYRNRTETRREKWTEELLQSLLKINCSCNNFGSSHEKNQDGVAIPKQADTMSEVISFCLMSGGLVLLFKLAFSEYIAYKNMMSEGKKGGHEDNNLISVSIEEFFQYRFFKFFGI
jgi:hypothetical protein